MSSAQPLAETIYVSKLLRTDTLDGGRVRQVFDVLGLPGMQVVCVSRMDEEEHEFRQESQEYRLTDGQTFTRLDDALLAWDELKASLALLDAVGALLLRSRHGLMRPLWEERTHEQKEPWLAQARQFLQLAMSLDLTITKRMRQ
jgi:hypothetical protein